MIGAQTRLSKALELHPDVLEYIVSLDPHDFERLRQPLMRRLMSPRITLARVAAIAGVGQHELLERIAALSGASLEVSQEASKLPASPRTPPPWLPTAEPDEAHTVNLLPMDARLDADPMIPVAKAIKSLKSGEVLLIRHRWEPQPFYDVWNAMRDLEWFSQTHEQDGWHIWVRRKPKNA